MCIRDSTKINADDLLSQALEHEIDHLNGIVFTDHLLSHSPEHFYQLSEPVSEEEAKEGSCPKHEDLDNSEFEALHRRLHGHTGKAEVKAPNTEVVTAGQNTSTIE